MTRRARAYLDGGPADGTTLELDHPDWAPLTLLRLEVDGVEVVYVRAKQHHPEPGEPWRYVPRDSVGDGDEAPTEGNYDPYDD